MEQAKSLSQEVIRSDMAHSDAGKKKEDVTHKTTDAMMEKRKHHDQILDKLYKLHSSFNTARESDSYLGPVGDSKCIDFLRVLSRLCEEYNKQVNDPATILFKELKKLTTPLVDEVQNKLGKGAYDNNRELKKEALSLVSNMEKDRWLSRECKDPYSDCVQPQNAATLAVQKSQMKSDELHKMAHHVYALLQENTPDKCMMALEQIKQMHDDLEGNPKGLTRKESEKIKNHLSTAREVAYSILFAPILDEYKQYPRSPSCRGVEQKYAAMCRHKESIIKLNPYVFVFNTYDTLRVWQCAASCAWYHDLDRLRHQTFFSENDVDTLLDLKDAAPELPISQIRNHLMITLTNLFQTMLQTNLRPALIEKVTKLSEWICDLDKRHHNVSQALCEYNGEWREKYVNEGGRATTSSSTSEARMPSSVPPGTLSVFPETFDCLSRMRLQNVPHAGQFSTLCPAVPTPAPYGSFQQSVSSIPCRAPIAQSAAGSSPFPPSWFGWPVLPCMPVPAYGRVGFHQPTSTGLWTDPAVAAAGTSQQQHEPRRSAMPFEEYRSGYSSSSHTW